MKIEAILLCMVLVHVLSFEQQKME